MKINNIHRCAHSLFLRTRKTKDQTINIFFIIRTQSKLICLELRFIINRYSNIVTTINVGTHTRKTRFRCLRTTKNEGSVNVLAFCLHVQLLACRKLCSLGDKNTCTVFIIADIYIAANTIFTARNIELRYNACLPAAPAARNIVLHFFRQHAPDIRHCTG